MTDPRARRARRLQRLPLVVGATALWRLSAAGAPGASSLRLSGARVHARCRARRRRALGRARPRRPVLARVRRAHRRRARRGRVAAPGAARALASRSSRRSASAGSGSSPWRSGSSSSCTSRRCSGPAGSPGSRPGTPGRSGCRRRRRSTSSAASTSSSSASSRTRPTRRSFRRSRRPPSTSWARPTSSRCTSSSGSSPAGSPPRSPACSRRACPPLLLWPFLLLVLVAPASSVAASTHRPTSCSTTSSRSPRFSSRSGSIERRAWLLASASRASWRRALLTKREGLMLVACLRRRRRARRARGGSWRFAWPRLGLAGGRGHRRGDPVACLVLVARPHRRASRGGRARAVRQPRPRLARLRSALTTLFDYDLWLVIVPLVRVAVVARVPRRRARPADVHARALRARDSRAHWVLWSFTELELPFVQDEGVNPIVRLSGSLVVVVGGARSACCSMPRGAARDARDGELA